MKHLKRDTGRGYQSQVATIKHPSDVIKQRCIKAKKQKKSARKKHYKHREHVDYLIDEIEKVTGDTHSRGAFAKVAMSVPDGRIQELLSLLKDRGNIRNPGAWFLSVARKYADSLKDQLLDESYNHQTDEKIISPDKLKIELEKLRNRLSMPSISVPQVTGDAWIAYDSW